MKKIALLLFFITVFVSCKKDPKNINISGILEDPYAKKSVAGAVVSIQTNGVVDGVYHSGYVTIATTKTDADGTFSFTIDEDKYDSFRFTFVKDGYFTSQKIIPASNISSNNSYNETFKIYTKSYLSVRLKNINPYDENDRIIVYFSNSPEECGECVNSNKEELIGANIDKTITGLCYGDYSLKLTYISIKNNVSNLHTDSIKTNPGDTIYRLIEY